MNCDITHILQSYIYICTLHSSSIIYGLESVCLVVYWSVISRFSLERFIVTWYRRYITNQHTVCNGNKSAGFIECGEFLD
jgi:hypothetical protein